MEFYSQIGQDKMVYNYYGSDFKGYFIELGAFDGIHLSNTYALEKNGWNGICIEPDYNQFNKLKENRKCHTICELVYSDKREVEFIIEERNELSKIKNNNEEKDSSIQFLNDKSEPVLNTLNTDFHNKEKRTTTTLTEILQKCNAPTHIDYMSLDTEGSEYDILQGIDFDKYTFGILHIEHNYREIRRKNIREFLKTKGYSFISENQFDDIYIKTSMVYTTYYLPNGCPIELKENVAISKWYQHDLEYTFDRMNLNFGNVYGTAKLTFNSIIFNIGNNIKWTKNMPDDKITLNKLPIYYHSKFLCLIHTTLERLIDKSYTYDLETITLLKNNNFEVLYLIEYHKGTNELDIAWDCQHDLRALLFKYDSLVSFEYRVANYFLDYDYTGILKINDNVTLSSINLESLISQNNNNNWNCPVYFMSKNTMYKIRYSDYSNNYNKDILVDGISHEIKDIPSTDYNYVTIHFGAGFGNILFQIAFLLDYANRTGKTPVLIKKLFNNQQHYSSDLCIKQILKCFPQLKIFEKPIDTFVLSSYIYSNMEYTNNYNNIENELNGYVYKYYEHIKNIWGNVYFKGRFMHHKYVNNLFKPLVLRNIDDDFNYSKCIFLHLRQGDYLTDKCHNVNLFKYYLNCLNNIQSNIENNYDYYVCYNGSQSTMKVYINKLFSELNINHIIYQKENDTPYNTLFIMSQCFGGICSNSTLSWMGAYLAHLNGKTKLYMPDKWLNKNKEYYEGIYPKWVNIISIN